jgi:hypothetical protein
MIGVEPQIPHKTVQIGIIVRLLPGNRRIRNKCESGYLSAVHLFSRMDVSAFYWIDDGACAEKSRAERQGGHDNTCHWRLLWWGLQAQSRQAAPPWVIGEEWFVWQFAPLDLAISFYYSN